MTPTREQYELAAKAAGYKIDWEDKDGITPTCPMWQQQNKEKS